MTQEQWFYDDGGSRVGPFTESDIRKLLTVKKSGMAPSFGKQGWSLGLQSKRQNSKAS